MVWLAVLTITFFALVLGLGLLSTHRKSARLKCLCRFESTTPDQDVGFIQMLLHEDPSTEVSRVIRRLEVDITFFEIEYSTNHATQTRVLGLMRARPSLIDLHVLSGSGAHGNVIFMSRQLSLTKKPRKEDRVSRYEAEHQQKRRRY